MRANVNDDGGTTAKQSAALVSHTQNGTLMPSPMKSTPMGAQIAALLLPLLAAVVLSVANSAERSQNTTPLAEDVGATTASMYHTEAFAPRFAPVWTIVLRSQYKSVVRAGNAIRAARDPDEKAMAESQYFVFLREYNQLAVRVPTGAFTGQNLPHCLPNRLPGVKG